ncbi:hypothetical protein AX14_003172 [Amanita brunnescens Koide BX004]|nr:hypothetical protein AX14_003172 [Amanita brunnescens Koide BX004]
MKVYTKRNVQSQEERFYSLSNARRIVGYIIFGTVGIDVTATLVVLYCYIRDKDVGDHLSISRLCFSQALIYIILMVVINACTAFSDIFGPMTASVSYGMTLMVPNLPTCRFILDLERAGNPTATQLFEQLSVIVRDRLEDVQGN